MSDLTPGYHALHFEPMDILSDDVMDRLSANIQAVHDYTPRALWTASNTRHSFGIKIASGRKLITKQAGNEVAIEVSFAGFFSPGCQPNITTGINARMQQNLYCTFSGRPGAGLTPNNDGMIVHLQVAKEDGEKKKIARNVWIHWIAMGY